MHHPSGGLLGKKKKEKEGCDECKTVSLFTICLVGFGTIASSTHFVVIDHHVLRKWNSKDFQPIFNQLMRSTV